MQHLLVRPQPNFMFSKDLCVSIYTTQENTLPLVVRFHDLLPKVSGPLFKKISRVKLYLIVLSQIPNRNFPYGLLSESAMNMKNNQPQNTN